MATKVKVKNVSVLQDSVKQVDIDGVPTLQYQANGYIYVDGNPYVGNADYPLNDPIKPEMVTMKTFFDLTCPPAQILEINQVAAVEAQKWLDINDPEVI